MPVPERPKKSETSPFSPAFAAQCIGKTSCSGKMKFKTPNIDFFISPAYAIPRIRTFFSVKLIITVPSELVPWTLGSQTKLGTHLRFHKSFFLGLKDSGLMSKL